ncbi:RES family NAD+ phosphorylase [Nocardia sp. NPDC004068]|uniref:RES family NAD+ phosphorylase n=1 Tax=Nocardia sp. NPDC004068 TaxID=3364303 RepID=UPI0036AE9226
MTTPRGTGVASGLPTTGVVPAPPAGSTLTPLIETWPQGREMYRGHTRGRSPREFNPGVGKPGRFSFFADTGGKTVPILYAGNTVDVAIGERLFHDLPLGSGAVLVSKQYRTVAYSRLAPRRRLRLASLHGDGLRRLGLRNHQLIDTDAIDYPDTVQWAAALHARADLALDGLIWMSRQFNTGQAVVLFGDRVAASDLDVDPDVNDRSFYQGGGLGLLLDAAERAGIRVGTPSRYLS